MTTRFRSPRLRASVALLALGLSLAACADDAPRTEGNDSDGVVSEIVPAPAPAEPDPAEAAAAEAQEPTPTTTTTENLAEPSAVGLDEEPVPVDQQTLEDAEATGMTSRYRGDEAAGGTSAGDDSTPAE